MKEIENCKVSLFFSFVAKKYINFNKQEKNTAQIGSE
jgi:hypothetical protein